MPVSSKKMSEKKAALGRKIKSQKGETKKKDRTVIYNKVDCRLYSEGSLGPLTVNLAKTYLGWQEEGEKEKFGKEFLLEHNGVKVRTVNNTDNRFFYKSKSDLLKQEILRGRWRFNGEPIIIGKTGQVYNGQHTLVSLILAVDAWNEHPDKYPFWESEPTIEKLVVLGIDEDDHVVNTIDTCQTRSGTDVIGRLPYFQGMKTTSDKRLCSKYTEWAIKMLWHRTASHTHAFSVKRTHSEMVAWLEQHSKIIDAVKHVHEENSEGKLGNWITPGYAIAALYLMATDESDPSKYYLDDNPREDLLDFSKWDRACEFFVELISGKSLEAARQEIRHLASEEIKVTPEERLAVIAGAWKAYRLGKPVTEKHTHVEYEIDENERRILASPPLFGGIDIGDELPFATNGDIEKKEEVEKRKEKIKAKKFPPKNRIANRKGDEWANGDRAWMHDLSLAQDNDATFVELVEDPWTDDFGEDRVNVEALETGEKWEATVEQLSMKQYELEQ